MHLDGQALQWYQNWMRNRDSLMIPSWKEFVEGLLIRFHEGAFEDPVSDFKRLQQTGTLSEYIQAFDVLLSKTNISKDLAMSFFLRGLEDSLEMHVRLFSPKTLQQAYSCAKLQSAAWDAKKKGVMRTSPKVINSEVKCSNPHDSPRTASWVPYKGNTNQNRAILPPSSSPGLLPTPPVRKLVEANTKSTRQGVSAKEMDDRKAKGLCMWCEEKFIPGHKCQRKHLYRLYLHEPDELEEEVQEAGDISAIEDVKDETPHISVHALLGKMSNQDSQTRRLQGWYKKRMIIYWWIQAAHNFLDVSLVKRVGCTTKKIDPLSVEVANGAKLKCARVQWLFTLGDIKWNFKQFKMEFWWQQRLVTLQGLGSFQIASIEPQQPNQLLLKRNAYSEVYLCLMRTLDLEKSDNSAVSLKEGAAEYQLQDLLQTYEDVFQEPKTLPPFRIFDHRINLKEGTQPINIKPYKHSTLQKDVIEELIKKMMENGVIQYSSSPYASPVILVKKKDNTWRICIDYRELNKNTIKDKYPIPIIEELLDELHGATIFSKLDLRSGYHQVRMFKSNIHKTAFRTHYGHYEFLVMPFGLTNAPSTFQRIMNEVFEKFLRKFVLVFFDDILVYSQNMEQHLVHLQQILHTLRKNRLYAKKSKCTFGGKQVEYLGHIIRAEGVATDPKKIAAIVEWPKPVSVKQLWSFLGLASYYRRFIAKFGQINKLLTNLLKKVDFKWSSEAEASFQQLKTVLAQTPILALPNFFLPFTIKTDASGTGMGAVLMQIGHPIAYLSKTFSDKHLSLSTYEKEMLALVLAVARWAHYLVKRYFIVRTDHKSLKFLLEQRLNTPSQHIWLTKLLGYDFDKCYKREKENAAADALSKIQNSQLLSISAVGCKFENVAYPGLLQPLPIPEGPWQEVSMDFIEGLPKSNGKEVVMVKAVTGLPLSYQPGVSFPIAILNRRVVKRRNAAVVQILVQWNDSSPSEATWEFWEDIKRRFPDFNLEDKVA
ncbi:uncharacterized protein [Elaeis guineensis]|uniref:uncharacterized protein n=1 Tax=Elaeis guineensis var. tenera TaxID=51953 RepID=UPI003C6D3F3E